MPQSPENKPTGKLGHYQREAYLLNGTEITREQANDIAIEWWREYIPGVAFIRAVVFRDCGTQENPSVSRHGKLWREYRDVTV